MTQEGESFGVERNRNIWAPWRTEYIEHLNQHNKVCFLCEYRPEGDDARKLVLWRGRKSFVLLNRFPYTGGHSMIAPYEHVANLSDLDAQTMLEMMESMRDVQLVLQRALHADGFNIGINFGACAGAGLPGHLHIHVVPRWAGDTNFMSVLGQVRVIPQSLEGLYDVIQKTAKEMNLPKAGK